jgi:phospholipid/cholesterol/gamma-HCH transport system substrate-binding protein
VLFHPINNITAYKGQIIYDTPETEAKAQTPVSYLQWQPLPGVTPPPISAETDLSSLILPPAPAAEAAPGQLAPAAAPAPGPPHQTRRHRPPPAGRHPARYRHYPRRRAD